MKVPLHVLAARAVQRTTTLLRACSRWQTRITAACLVAASSIAMAGSFSPGNLAVLQTLSSSNNTTASIVELNTSTAGQAPVQTILIDGTGTSALRFSGSATSSGYLSRSQDGTLLAFTGHNDTNTAVNANTLTARGVATLNPSGAFSIATTYTGASGNQARSATTIDNSIWFIADQAGIFTNGGTSASPTGNIRSIRAFGGTVYTLSASAALSAVSTVSAPSGGALAGLPGLGSDTTAADFYLVQSGASGSVFDILYVLTSGGIKKYSLVAGAWTANGIHASVSGFGLTAAASSGSATLYVSTGGGATSANSVVKVVDTAGYNAAISINNANNVTLYTAPVGSTVKGVAFAPVPIVPDLTVSVSAPGAVNVGANFDYTLIATNSGTAPATGVALQFTLPAGLDFVNATGDSGFTGANNAGTIEFSGGSTAQGASATLTVTVTTSAGGAYTAPVGAAIIDPANAITETIEGNNASTIAAVTNILAAPVITTHPNPSQTIASGATATLTVAASGHLPPTYQWYEGVSGDTSNPVGGATSASFETPALTMTKSYWALATNASGSAPSDTAVVNVSAANANLLSLTLSAGTLNPPFASETLAYTAMVPNVTSSIIVTPTTEDTMAAVAVNGSAVVSGSPSEPIALNPGPNFITIAVTAPDLVTTKNYTVTVTRQSNDATLSTLTISAGILTPAFDPLVTAYTAAVSNATISLTATPTTASPAATVTVNGDPVASGSSSTPIALNVGSNSVSIVVTAEDLSTQTYTLVVTRAGSSNADLSNLVLSTGAYSPAFAAGRVNYLQVVSNATASLTVTPTKADANATIVVNGLPVASGSPSESIALNEGHNTISVAVAAEDAVTIKAYTVSVIRQSNAVLAPGAIAFTGYNADGTDNLAFVALVNIPSATVIFFTDEEWNGTDWTANTESQFAWTATSAISAGTIVTLDNLNNIHTGTPVPVSSLGVITAISDATDDPGVSSGDEAIYAFQGSGSLNASGVPVPTAFLAVIANEDPVSAIFSLANTGLSEAAGTAIIFTEDDDGTRYKGPRNGKRNFAAYLADIADRTNNWDTVLGGDGNTYLPFNTAPFTAGPGVQVTVNDASISEGDAGATLLTFTVSRATNTGAFTVQYATADGTSTRPATLADNDYVAGAGTITFTEGGSLTDTFTVTINGDTTVEGDETLFVNLSNLSSTVGNAILTDAQGIGTILTDDPTPPLITTHPATQTIATGAKVTLTVVAEGFPALSYQWYEGSSGDTANPIGSATAASFTSPVLLAATNYWVRVTNAQGSADSNTANISVGFGTPYSAASINILTRNDASWNPAGVSVGGTQFINLGLQGVGRVPANAIDPVTGESVGSVSDMQITGWRKNANGSYSGTFNFLPDRGFNSTAPTVVFSNYAARINKFDVTFTPYTASTPTTAQDQIALTFAGSTRFTYDHDANGVTPPVFTTGLLANAGVSLFGTTIPVVSGDSTQSDGTVTNRLTLDSEGLILDQRLGKSGSGWIGDEYGAYIYHFNSAKQIDGVVLLPESLIPHATSGGPISFIDVPANVDGRRVNQGMEGIAQSPDGTKLFGLMQSATIQDSGAGNQGRFNTRLVVYDVSATDTPSDPIAQYVIQLPRIDDTGSTTNGTTVNRTGAQSAILALNDHQLLILARDGNGRGVQGSASPVFKSILLADLSTATNIDGTYDAAGNAVAPAGALAVGVTPISWTEALNMIGKLGGTDAEVAKFGLNLSGGNGDINTISEKWEALGLVSANEPANPNDYFLFIGNDNDFLSGSGKYLDATGAIQSYDGGLENDTVVLAYRVRFSGAFNQAPFVANPIPNQSITIGTALSFTFAANTFTDPEDGTLTYTATKDDDSASPTWLTFNPATRTFSGTPAAADVGPVAVKVTATDNGSPNLSSSASFTITVSQRVHIAAASVTEGNAGTVTLQLPVTRSSTATEFTVNYAVTGGTATSGTDYVALAAGTLTFEAGGPATKTLAITINGDTTVESNETITVTLSGLVNITGTTGIGTAVASGTILNDDTISVVYPATNAISSNVKGSIALAGAEIPAFDPISKRAFASSNVGIQVVDLTNPAAPSLITTIAPATLGVPGLSSNDTTSVAVRKGKGGNPSVLAAAILSSPKTAPGYVIFLDAGTGALLGSAVVGANPDNLSFTPDGTKVLVANEGEVDGTAADVAADATLGSVSIINVAGGFAAPPVSTADFTAYDSQVAALRAAGVRIFKNAGGTDAVLSRDFEPEYIASSPDSTKAMVTIQEANAVAILDLSTATFTSIKPLGKKDFSPLRVDFSDRDGPAASALINPTTGNPVYGMYMPDAIASYQSGGQVYYVTANEGDDRNDFVDPDETTTVGAANYVLDPATFANAAALKSAAVLGRLTVCNSLGLRGDTDNDGDIDEILSYGGRSFSILDAAGNLVFDSGDMVDLIVASQHLANFDDTRSDNKGSEPEGVVIATFGARTYAFIGLERSHMVAVFDVTNPAAVTYTTSFKRAGDLNPEGMVVVAGSDSPSGKPLLITANEVSNTLTIFEVDGAPAADFTLQVLHYYGESGLLGIQTAPILGALIDRFDTDYANTLVIGEGDSFIPGPWLIAGADPSFNRLLHTGTFTGAADTTATPFAQADIAIMNAFGTTVSALGNHEFDLGSPVLAAAIYPANSSAVGNWAGAQFPLISANLDFAADSALRGRVDTSLGGTGGAFAGQEVTSMKGKIAPYAIKTIGGQSVGFVGATTFELLSKSSPNGTVPKDDGNAATDDLQEVAAYLQSAIDALVARGVNKIVMVDQLDTLQRNKDLAGMVSGIDVMVAGGGHERMGDATDTAVPFNGHDADFIADAYPIVTAGQDGKPVLIVTTDTEYTYLGRLVLDFDSNGELILGNLSTALNGAYAASESTLQAVYATTDSAATIVAGSAIGSSVKTITDAINAVVVAKDSNIYGYTNVYLEGDRVFGRTQEVNLGDITADANAWVARTALGLTNADAVFSLKNGGGLRASIGSVLADGTKVGPLANPVTGKPTNAISQLDVENALRFDNKLMVCEMTPAGLLHVLNFAAGLSSGPTVQSGGYAQVGNIRFSYDSARPVGQKVRTVVLINEAGVLVARVVTNGAVRADAPASIPAVVLNFTMNGGDSYPIKYLNPPTNTTPHNEVSNFRYLLTNGTLSAPIDRALDFTAASTFASVGLTAADIMGEQKAFQDFVGVSHSTAGAAYNIADTPVALDTRIQQLVQNGNVDNVDPNLPPVLSLPTSPVLAEATSADGALVTFTVTASDPQDGQLTPSVNPASGSLFPLGDTIVNVSATDSASSTTSDSFTVTVQDTIAPLVTPPDNVVVSTTNPTGVTVTFPAATAFDAVGVISITYSKDSGTVFPVGTTIVTVTATDAAGNPGIATFMVTVNGAISDPLRETLFTKGGAVPGAGVDSRIPAGSTWASFGIPSINGSGEIAFLGKWKSPASSGQGIFAGPIAAPTLLLSQGESPTALGGLTFASFRDPLFNDAGDVVVLAAVSGTGVTTANKYTLLATTLGAPANVRLLAREGASVAEAGNAILRTIANVALSERSTSAPQSGNPAAVFFTGTLLRDSGTPTVLATNDTALWSVPAGGSSAGVLFREGGTVDLGGAALQTVKSFSALKPRSGSPGHGRGAVLQPNGAAAAVLLVKTTQGSVAVGSITETGEATFGYKKAQTAPGYGAGTLFASFGGPIQDERTALAFRASLSGGTANSTNNQALYSEDENFVLGLVVVKGATSPGVPGGTFRSFKDPVSAQVRHLSFVAKVAGVPTAADEGIWTGDEFGLDLVAREGSAAPEAGGGLFNRFISVAQPAGAPGPLFTAQLVVDDTLVTRDNDQGLWGVTSVGAVRSLIREGDVINTKTVKSFTVLKSVTRSTTHTRAFNSSSGVILRAYFTDGSQGLVRITVP